MNKALALILALSFATTASAQESKSIYESLQLSEPKTTQESSEPAPVSPAASAQTDAPAQSGIELTQEFIAVCMQQGLDADKIDALLKGAGSVPFPEGILEDTPSMPGVRGYSVPTVFGPYSVIFDDIGDCSVSAVQTFVDMPVSVKNFEAFFAALPEWRRVDDSLLDGKTPIGAYEMDVGEEIVWHIAFYKVSQAGQNETVFIQGRLTGAAPKAASP
ncbi:MAG: hypothetical protein KA144_12500 [Xanthomonadaceae bacterium]|nr:hypothetical protein [Xanthomonadaceae bacterium]